MNSTSIEQAREILQQESEAIASIANQLDHSLDQVLDLLMQCQGHVFVAGTGTSRFVAERMAHLLNCCGTPAMFINAADSLHGGAGAVTDKEVLLLISKGGKSSEINEFAKIAKSRGAKLIALTENKESPLAELCDAVLCVKSPEDVDPFGMIATGSSLVNSAVGDIVCVLLLHRRGYSKDQFARTHPGGAVGKKIELEKEQS